MKTNKPIGASNGITCDSVGPIELGSHGFSPSSRFWKDFVRDSWKRQPLIIKNPFSPPISTSEEIFVSLKNAATEFESKGAHVQCVFYKGADGFQLTGPKLRRYMPKVGDSSLTDYAERISKQLNGECFGLVLHELQEHYPEFYLRTREFLSGLAARVRARWRAIPGLFVGNYQQTPFGIHQDPANVFDFIIEGRKRIYLWPEDYFRDSFDQSMDSDLARLGRDATILEAKAGDVLYWPGRYWHVGESVGRELSVSVSVALMPVNLSNVLVNQIKNHVEELIVPVLSGDSGFPNCVVDVEKSPKLISKTVRRAGKRLKRTSQDELIRGLQVSWLNQMSSEGSQPPPAPRPIETVKDDYYVRCIPGLPLLWIRASNNQIICSANGHSVLVPAAPAIKYMLKKLNEGRNTLVKDLIRAYAGSSRQNGQQFKVTEEGIRFLLSKLHSFRALRMTGVDDREL